MKTFVRSLPRQVNRFGLALMVASLAATSALGFPVITNVVETGGDNEATDTITAKWTGVTWNTTIANEPLLATPVGTPFTVPRFGEDVPAMVDRATEWNGATVALPIPNYLLGAEYVMIGNDNRENVPFQLDIYLNQRAAVFMIIDNRRGDGTGASGNPPFDGLPVDQWSAMTWMNAGGFQPMITGRNRASNPTYPDEVGWDEIGTKGVGPGMDINQYASIYYKVVDPGAVGTPAISTYEYGQGVNMYGVVVIPATPEPPAGLQAASLNGRVRLDWAAAAGGTNYVISRGTISGGPYVEVGQSAGASFTDSTVVNGETYYYVVRTMGYFGNGNNSAQVIGTPKLAPESLVASGGTNQIRLSWTAMTGTDSYTVKRSALSGGPFTNLATGVISPSYLDASLPSGVRFYYTVSAALTGGGESANADEAFAVTAPTLPGSFVAERFATTVIKLSWKNTDQVPPTTLVERSANGTTFTQIGVVANGGKIYLDVNLAANITNYYRIRATNSGGFTAYTTVASASTPISGINVNFANTNFTTGQAGYPIPGFIDDYGFIYGDRGNGKSYGWDDDNTANARLRNADNSPDKRYDTFNHTQKTSPARVWEIAVPNGLYAVRIVCGDPTAVDSTFQWDVEGWVTGTRIPNNPNFWQEFNVTTKVEDGRMTFSTPATAANNKINFVDIYPATPQANLFGLQPVSQTVTQNQTVTFSASVISGPEPYRFQWYGPAGVIFGAEGPTYSIQNPQLTDAGTYYVVVTNAGAFVQSTNAVLTVIQDVWPPTVQSAGSVDGSSIGIQFNEAVDIAAATTPGNYRVNGQANTVTSVTQRGDRTMQLLLLAPITGNFTVTIDNMKDLAGNTMPSRTVNGLNMGLTPVELGFPALIGESFTVDGINLSMVAGGTDIWGSGDQGHFAYKQVSGDFDARLRVTSLTRANDWTKAGLMVRETTSTDSRNVFILATPLPLNNLYQTQWREDVAGASASAPTISPVSYPDAWLRLVRQGNTFVSFIKTNGVDWVWHYTYTPTNAYAPDLLLGMALTSHDANLTATGMFNGFSTTAPVPDVAVYATASPTTIAQGGTVTYTVTVRNLGSSASGIIVSDTLPPGLTYLGTSTTNGTAAFNAGTVTWTLGNLAPGGLGTLTVSATVTGTGSITNTISAVSSGTEETLANNSAIAVIQVPTPPVMDAPGFTNGKFGFSVSTQAGLNYRVEYTDTLQPINWLTLTNFPGNGLVRPVVDPGPAPTSRYYRTLIVP